MSGGAGLRLGGVINEVFSANVRTLVDEDGGAEERVALRNAGENAIDVSGWGLRNSGRSTYGELPRGYGDASRVPIDGVWIRQEPTGGVARGYASSWAGGWLELTVPEGALLEWAVYRLEVAGGAGSAFNPLTTQGGSTDTPDFPRGYECSRFHN